MKKIAVFLISLLVLQACDKDDIPSFTTHDFPIVEEVIYDAPYKCYEIGNQIWMAENLRLRLEGGREDGCMTYREKIVSTPDKSELIEPLRQTIESGVYGDNIFEISTYDYLINGEIIPQFMTQGGPYYRQSWETYSESFRSVIFNEWAFAYFDKIETEYLKIEQEVRKEMVRQAEDSVYAKEFGYLYTYDAAKQLNIDGWRLPSDDDWKKLEQELGMSTTDVDKLEEWRGNIGTWMKEPSSSHGFNAKLGGAYTYGIYQYGDKFINKGTRGYWWTSSKSSVTASDTTDLYIIRAVRLDENKVFRGTSKSEAAYNVRLVKDK